MTSLTLGSWPRRHPGLAIPAVATAGMVGLALIVGHAAKSTVIRAVTAGVLGGLVCYLFKDKMAQVFEELASYLRNSGSLQQQDGAKIQRLAPAEWVADADRRLLGPRVREEELKKFYAPVDWAKYGRAEAEAYYSYQPRDATVRTIGGPQGVSTPHATPDRNLIAAEAKRKLSPSFGLPALFTLEAEDLARQSHFEQLEPSAQAAFVTRHQPLLHPGVLRALGHIEARRFEASVHGSMPILNVAKLAAASRGATPAQLSEPGFDAVIELLAKRFLRDEVDPIPLDQRRPMIAEAFSLWQPKDEAIRDALFTHVDRLEAQNYDAIHHDFKNFLGVVQDVARQQLSKQGYRFLAELAVARAWRSQSRQSSEVADYPRMRRQIMLPLVDNISASPEELSGMLDRAIGERYLDRHYHEILRNGGRLSDKAREGLEGAAAVVEDLMRNDHVLGAAPLENRS